MQCSSGLLQHTLYPALDPSVKRWLPLDPELERKITVNFLYCRKTCLLRFNVVKKKNKSVGVALLAEENFITIMMIL